MNRDIIITDLDTAAAVLGALDRYHRHCEREVTLSDPLPEPAVAAWQLARDVTPPSGAGSAPGGA